MHMHTGVVWPRGVNMGNPRLIGAEMEACQVRDWIVGECEWRLINVRNVHYHELKNLAGNQRNVTIAAYGKSKVVSIIYVTYVYRLPL